MNRWLSLTIFSLLFIFGGATAALAQPGTTQVGKKVTVTLVRWPYT